MRRWQSKAARRQRERRLRLIQGGRAESDAGDAAGQSVVEEREVDSAQQPWERMLPVEEWS